jgi:hypothetical protein
MTQDPVMLLDPSLKSPIADIICQAFENDPAAMYAAPDLIRRRHLLSWYARTGLAWGFTRGEIFVNSGQTGVAVWLRPSCADLSSWSLLQIGILPPGKAGSENGKRNRFIYSASLSAISRNFIVSKYSSMIHSIHSYCPRSST